MSERILEIVVFLMDYMREEQGWPSDSDDFSSTLKTMGYSEHEISSAYFWLLNRFSNTPERLFSDFQEVHHSTRILTATEQVQLTTEAYGFLVKLSNLLLIDDEQFEDILERTAIFGPDSVTQEQVKLVASSVVFGELEEPVGFDSFDPKFKHSILVN